MRAFAETLARGSGALLRDKQQELREIDTKSTPTDLVTDADKASEAWLVKAIRETYPDHAILGEEGTGDPSLLDQDGYVWVIDPLDGTVNYAHQLPMYAVSIGLLLDGQPLLGAIYLPVLDQMFSAERSQGATLNGQPISVSDTPTLQQAVLATGFSYDKHISEQDNLANLTRLLKRIRGIRRMGAAAVDLAYTACGRLDGYWEEKIQPWDIAAGVIIVQEAGGTITGYTGEPVQLAQGHLIASNGHLHQAIREELAPYAAHYNIG